jgi:hypothetical protein
MLPVPRSLLPAPCSRLPAGAQRPTAIQMSPLGMWANCFKRSTDPTEVFGSGTAKRLLGSGHVLQAGTVVLRDNI